MQLDRRKPSRDRWRQKDLRSGCGYLDDLATPPVDHTPARTAIAVQSQAAERRVKQGSTSNKSSA